MRGMIMSGDTDVLSWLVRDPGMDFGGVGYMVVSLATRIVSMMSLAFGSECLRFPAFLMGI